MFYVGQLAMKLRAFEKADLTKPQPVYFTLNWESTSKNRTAYKFGWELLKKDVTLIDYVIIHEMSHLIYGDHSQKFWALVGENLPNYKKFREEMKEF